MEYLAENKSRILGEYKTRRKALGNLLNAADEQIEQVEEQNVKLSLKYLFTHMPISDMENYEPELFLSFAEHAVMLWENDHDIQNFSEEIFLNYILFYRVNDEEIMACRALFFEQITNYLKNRSKRKADNISAVQDAIEKKVLDINWWCAENVTYHVTDGRTRAAKSIYQSGFGRCGEESVFTVNALRSMGVPARQVYVPKWAHCDDNHAWVEVYVRGKWHFIGACEPEPVLDRGWFETAASRAMMVHSRWFDTSVPANEKIIGRDGMVTMLNQLSRYAATGQLTVKVLDEDEQPASKAKVYCNVLNYSEFMPIAVIETDQNGNAELLTGEGNLYLEALSKGKNGESRYAAKAIDVQKDKEVTLVLKEMPGTKCRNQKFEKISFLMKAPAETNRERVCLSEKQEEGKRAQLEETNRRRELLHKDMINEDIERFLHIDEIEENKEIRKKLISDLSVKDQTDVTFEVLTDVWNTNFKSGKRSVFSGENLYPEKIWINCVLHPRIENEILMPHRKRIQEFFTEQEKDGFILDPRALWQYLNRRISSQDREEYNNLITTPAACLYSGAGSKKSKDILFVAILRALGIPAELNPVNKEPEYYENGNFIPVETVNRNRNADLIVRSEETGKNMVSKFFEKWTISRWTDEGYQTLDLSNCHVNEERMEIQLESGGYRIITSYRYPNGNQEGTVYSFYLEEKEKKDITLNGKKLEVSDFQEHPEFPGVPFAAVFEEQGMANKIFQSGRHVLIWLECGREPTQHLIHEILEKQKEYKKYAEKFCVMVQNEKDLYDPMMKKLVTEVPGMKILIDANFDKADYAGKKMKMNYLKFPMIMIADNKGKIFYTNSGYNVGIGELLLQIIKMKEEM